MGSCALCEFHSRLPGAMVPYVKPRRDDMNSNKQLSCAKTRAEFPPRR